MKKRISIIALLGLTIATIAFGVDKLIDQPSGDLILDSNNQVIIKKEIIAQVQSPGFVPIGGMVAVMPNVSGAWQPPASGAVKDGFMRADGSTVSDAESPLNGQVLPTMTGNTYARGDSTSGGTGGANSQASNVTVGDHLATTLEGALADHDDIDIAHGHGFTQPSAHGITQPAFNVPGHYHGFGLGSGLTGGSHDHTFQDLGEIFNSDAGPGGISSINNYGAAANITPNITSSGDHGHGGTIGLVTGGSNGNAAFAASRSTDVALSNNHSGGAVTSLGTTNKSISAHDFTSNISHSVTNNSVNNEPKYVSVIWVIRVK